MRTHSFAWTLLLIGAIFLVFAVLWASWQMVLIATGFVIAGLVVSR
jgi:hypothetical protein